MPSLKFYRYFKKKKLILSQDFVFVIFTEKKCM